MRSTLVLFASLVLTACATKPAPQTTTEAPSEAGQTRAVDLPRQKIPFTIPTKSADAALKAFRATCPRIVNREDRTGLTQPLDWQTACKTSETAPDAVRFFTQAFEAVEINQGTGFATGYFEPEILGARVRTKGYDVPLYRRPPDLVDVDLGVFKDEWKGRTLRGRLEGRRIVPYHSRAAIAEGALAGKSLELAWAADANDSFFLEIQGSGRLRLPNGEVMRIGYDSQNGRDYVAIGRVLLDQGKLPKGGVSMQSIKDWLRTHPDEAQSIRNTNPSTVFFSEIKTLDQNEGPRGSLAIPLYPQISVAVDPLFIPYGAPLIATLAGGTPQMHVAMDTGGAIKGPGRLDVFQGSGPEAGKAAGSLASKARVILLLPRRASVGS